VFKAFVSKLARLWQNILFKFLMFFLDKYIFGKSVTCNSSEFKSSDKGRIEVIGGVHGRVRWQPDLRIALAQNASLLHLFNL